MRKIGRDFRQEIFTLALPITIQSLFQSSLSIIDQIMVGSLGSISIAGIGLGGKFASIVSVTIVALCTSAGILISQYYGAKDQKGIWDSFTVNMGFALVVSLIFTGLSLGCPEILMKCYSKDLDVIKASTQYLSIVAISFIPMTITLMFSTVLRSIGLAKMPMYASISSVIINTSLNYVFIFGKLGCPMLGLKGAAVATTLSRIIEMLILLVYFSKVCKKGQIKIHLDFRYREGFLKQVWKITYPILLCEFLWSLGENIYASIYGRLGTLSCAAMTLTGPIQSLVIGLFSGVSAAAGIMVGNRLGTNEMDEAYNRAKAFIKIGTLGSLVLSIMVVVIAPFYVHIFNVESQVRTITVYILWVYALIAPVKILNMIASGGILRSGGKTYYTLILDLVGTWLIGIPLGFFSAYYLKWPIEAVYFLLSLEEVFRLVVTLILFKQRKWMNQLA